MNRTTATAVAEDRVAIETDPDVVAQYLEDAAHFPGGHTPAVARPASVAQVASVVRHASAVLAVGARSSLTGGATPQGEVVLSTERLTELQVRGDRVRAGAGVTLQALQDALAPHALWFPPVPTYLGATVGGAVSTNAAGAATFKYGPVRGWVDALTVVLACGDVLYVRRGEAHAAADGSFLIGTSQGELRVPVPPLRMPAVPKCAAGYFAAPGMDLVDLFIGAEGTLGVIAEAELRVTRRPAGVCWLLTPMPSETAGIRLAGALREQRSLAVAAIEHVDRRSIDVLREDGVDRRLGVDLPLDADTLLLTQLEVEAADAREGLGTATLELLAALLGAHGALETTEIVLPGNARRARALVELREAVPAGVNRRVGQAHAADPRVHKTAADMIVPFERFAEMLDTCRRLASTHGVDLAVWGHISDGNVHPNVIPRSYSDVERGRALIVALAERVIAMGGAPLAEHGVGRNRAKQQLLAMLYGTEGVEAMRRTKLGIDPGWKLAPGLLFERRSGQHAR